ncbi:hypothetical protein HII17_01545 [Thalassotalea sp. M1531]|uniref:WD40-like Beta Propeller Repeat n=1 Tax=Thalassotalea algicola TaxID=2716224 RepID=A0A7Y0Q5L1_9GAMM|nr:PD40 domain-containing protein [Thalassotalea algicola]NMP30231.1 hypothetical protein [Thalassotalea algicola]
MSINKLYISALILMAIAPLSSAAKVPYHSEAAQTKAVIFAPGVVSTDAFEINTVFNKTGDKVLFARCTNDFKRCTMMESKFENDQWQIPKALPFSGGYLEADPYYNEDYSAIYFVSKRPIDEGGKETKNVNLWRAELTNGKWQSPEYLAHLSSKENDLYPSITSNGDLYYPSFRNNERKMYLAKKNGDSFDAPVALPTDMFGDNAKIGDSVVLPDGNTIIFSMRRADSLGKGDLYISKKINGKWTLAKSLGEKVNTKDHEFTPIVSPDGNYLFFTRIENGVGNLYQIALTAL